MNALELEDIKMQFNQKVLFENLDLAIEKERSTRLWEKVVQENQPF